MKLLVTGATGTVGSEVIRQALQNPNVTSVIALVRRPLPTHVAPNPSNHKLETILHEDFTTYPAPLLEKLNNLDAVIWAQGISSIGMKEDEYLRITRDYPMNAAKALSTSRAQGQEKLVFCYLSGHGASQNERQASQMFGKVKGRAEKALAELGNTTDSRLAVYSFRPAGICAIHPTPGASPQQRFANFAGPTMRRILPNMMISTDLLAQSMIRVALEGKSGAVKGWPGKGGLGDESVFDRTEIPRLAAGSDA